MTHLRPIYTTTSITYLVLWNSLEPFTHLFTFRNLSWILRLSFFKRKVGQASDNDSYPLFSVFQFFRFIFPITSSLSFTLNNMRKALPVPWIVAISYASIIILLHGRYPFLLPFARYCDDKGPDKRKGLQYVYLTYQRVTEVKTRPKIVCTVKGVKGESNFF